MHCLHPLRFTALFAVVASQQIWDIVSRSPSYILYIMLIAWPVANQMGQNALIHAFSRGQWTSHQLWNYGGNRASGYCGWWYTSFPNNGRLRGYTKYVSCICCQNNQLLKSITLADSSAKVLSQLKVPLRINFRGLLLMMYRLKTPPTTGS